LLLLNGPRAVRQNDCVGAVEPAKPLADAELPVDFGLPVVFGDLIGIFSLALA
jgi:hypothetical protein